VAKALCSKGAFDRTDTRYLADVLARTHHNLSAASRESGIDRKHLRTLARKHGLIDDRSGDPASDDDA
jgi:transcriptional regulator with GAF, ATPase, and Fis domain